MEKKQNDGKRLVRVFTQQPRQETMTTRAGELAGRRESCRWIRKIPGVITYGDWKQSKEERMTIYGIKRMMVSSAKKGKKHRVRGVWKEGWVKTVSPAWMCWVGGAADALNCRYCVGSWAYGAGAQIRSQQDVSDGWICPLTQYRVCGAHCNESPFSEWLFVATAGSAFG